MDKGSTSSENRIEGFVPWGAETEFHDLPGWLCLLLVRAWSPVLSSLPKHALLCHQTAFLVLHEMKEGISKVSGAEKQWMAPIRPCLFSFLPGGHPSGPCWWWHPAHQALVHKELLYIQPRAFSILGGSLWQLQMLLAQDGICKQFWWGGFL